MVLSQTDFFGYSRSVPSSSGAFMAHHREKCARFSSMVRGGLPTWRDAAGRNVGSAEKNVRIRATEREAEAHLEHVGVIKATRARVRRVVVV